MCCLMLPLHVQKFSVCSWRPWRLGGFKNVSQCVAFLHHVQKFQLSVPFLASFAFFAVKKNVLQSVAFLHLVHCEREPVTACPSDRSAPRVARRAAQICPRRGIAR